MATFGKWMYDITLDLGSKAHNGESMIIVTAHWCREWKLYSVPSEISKKIRFFRLGTLAFDDLLMHHEDEDKDVFSDGDSD